MKRGRGRPNIATKWVSGGYPGPVLSPPMFVKVEFVALMVWPVDDPDIFPVPVTGDDCSIGKYSYGTLRGASVWAGEWENVYGDGVWHFSQQLDRDLNCVTCFSLYYGEPTGGRFIAEWSAPNTQDGLWNDAFVDRHGATEWLMPSYPWVWMDFTSVVAVNYDQLRSLEVGVRPNKPNGYFYD